MQMWGAPFQAPEEMPRKSQPESGLMDVLELQTGIAQSSDNSLDSSLLDDLEEPAPSNEPEADKENKVRKECEQCSRPFEIALPEGVEAAYTNCPYCGSEELVSLGDAV